MKRSHTTQELLNYFDENDTRVREMPYTIDAQLLNVAAEQLDDESLRARRELNSRKLPLAPAAIDNRGLYFEARLPIDYILPREGEPLPTVEGLRNGVWTALSLYDDRLPVPVRLEYDPDANGIALADCRILDVSGSGNGVGSLWDIKVATPGELSFPNYLTFWLDGLYDQLTNVEILIEGERHPRPAWVAERRKDVERVVMGENGVARTTWPWAKINQITVRNLPTGIRLQGWVLPMNLPYTLDATRPFTHPGWRDRLFPRYWQIENSLHLLSERYFTGNFGGYEYIQSYSTPADLVDLAIEPNTWGMWAASQNSLYYFDRREPMPGSLTATGLTREPVYGLRVEYDITRHGSPRAVILTPEPYTAVPMGLEYRYTVQDPAGNLFVLLLDGSLVTYTGSVGWKVDIPKPARLALTQTGTYIFTLETIDRFGSHVLDSQPYPNLDMAPLRTFDLSTIVPEIKGIGFDYLQRLWVWTGSYLIPLRPAYDAFVIDQETRSIYTTDFFEQVRFS
jgi:hypothetical protein